MRDRARRGFPAFAFVRAGLCSALLITTVAFLTLCAQAQNGQPPQQAGQNGQGVPGLRPNVPAHRAPSGPTPVKDISGVWAGTAAPRVNPPRPMTPVGQAAFKANKPFFGRALVPVADSNDPMIHCDPIGFPRDVLFEIRGIKFVQIPTETLQLDQYQRTWREIWTDGRALPTGVGGDAPDAPDPRYYGYSIGHWDGDYTFVINTVGMDERAWLDENGHVKSGDAKVEERYQRLDHDTLEYTVTVDDPKMYTQPYNAIKFDLQWNPKGEFEEQLCIPTEMDAYMKIIGNPAGAQKN